MRLLRLLLIGGSALLFAGCGGAPPPLVVHGQPVDYWLPRCQDRDVRQRRQAVAALGNAGTADPRVVPALAQATADSDAAVRRTAILSLLRLGPAAQEALPALERAAQKDPEPSLRRAAQQAVLRLRTGEK
jgi:HEAT repeat protein